MEEKIIIEEVEFDEELYEKNILENDFSSCEEDGIGDDEDAINES